MRVDTKMLLVEGGDEMVCSLLLTILNLLLRMPDKLIYLLPLISYNMSFLL